MVTHSQWYVGFPSLSLFFFLSFYGASLRPSTRHDSFACPCRGGPLPRSAPLPSTLALRLHGGETPPCLASPLPCLSDNRARAHGCSTAVVVAMSGHSSPKSSPQPPRASSSSSKADKADELYDANIRNFAPVARIMKTALPENAKIAKEAKECMQECVSEFISFITSEGKPCLRCSWGPPRPSLTYHSVREMPSGEEENSQRRGHPLRHELARLRELRRGSQDLLVQVPRGNISPVELCTTPSTLSRDPILSFHFLSFFVLLIINSSPSPIGARTSRPGLVVKATAPRAVRVPPAASGPASRASRKAPMPRAMASTVRNRGITAPERTTDLHVRSPCRGRAEYAWVSCVCVFA